MLNNIHDSFFKNMFSVKENLQDLLQGTLPREVISRVHLETLEYDPTEYVDQELDPYFRDINCNMLYGKARQVASRSSYQLLPLCFIMARKDGTARRL